MLSHPPGEFVCLCSQVLIYQQCPMCWYISNVQSLSCWAHTLSTQLMAAMKKNAKVLSSWVYITGKQEAHREVATVEWVETVVEGNYIAIILFWRRSTIIWRNMGKQACCTGCRLWLFLRRNPPNQQNCRNFWNDDDFFYILWDLECPELVRHSLFYDCRH